MEQSTFNLVDLCSPSGHDAGLAVTPCHASMDQVSGGGWGGGGGNERGQDNNGEENNGAKHKHRE